MNVNKTSSKKYPMYKVFLALFWGVMLSACTSKEVEEMDLDGKILKDSEENYYLVEQHMGDSMFIKKLNLTGYNKF